MSSNKFNFYDVVTISSNQFRLKKVNGEEGVIRGMAQNEDTGEWGYGVKIDKDECLVWHIMEENLKPTGKKASPEDYGTGRVAKVSVNLKTGEGELIKESLS